MTVTTQLDLFLLNFLILSSSHIFQNMSQHEWRWQRLAPRAGLIPAVAGLKSKFILGLGQQTEQLKAALVSLHNSCTTEDGWALHNVAPSAGGGGDHYMFSLLLFRFTSSMEWDLKPLLVSSITLLLCFRGNWEKSSDSRMFLEFCSNLAQSLTPISHRCQVEIITLYRHNWPESNPSRVMSAILSGKQLLQSCMQWLRVCTKRSWRTDHKFRPCIPVWQKALPTRDRGRSESPHQQWSDSNYTTSCLSIQDYTCGI